MRQIEIQNSQSKDRAHVNVLSRHVPLVSRYIWHLRKGQAVAKLYDPWQLEVEMSVLINNPCLVEGSHGAN